MGMHAAGPRSSTATGTRARPSSCSEPIVDCWSGCACRATRSSRRRAAARVVRAAAVDRAARGGAGGHRERGARSRLIAATMNDTIAWPRGGRFATGSRRRRSRSSPALLAAAPHRLMFFAGASAIITVDALVGGCALRRALRLSADAACAGAARLGARDPDAVRHAAAVRVRFPADRVPALDEPARAAAEPLRAGVRRHVRRLSRRARRACSATAASSSPDLR